MSTTAMTISTNQTTRISLKEEDVVKLACEFLHNRQLNISQVTLERESGVINANFSDDLLFLRQLILDGQWEDILEFIQPLCSLQSFDQKLFHFLIHKAKYIELLCIKGEAPMPSPENAVDSVVEVLKEIEQTAPSKEHYSNLCLLLTLNRLSEHPDYQSWNPSKGRINCFKEILPLVKDLLGVDKNKQQQQQKYKSSSEALVATNDRLLQLMIKGILYESCVDFCQQKATGAKQSSQVEFTNLLSPSDFGDSDLSLLSWLQSIPNDTFACPFEQRNLVVDIERLKAPQLETSWTEHMLITPIKPNIFPHSAMPSTRPKGADMMTKSLNMSAHLGHKGKGLADKGPVLDMSKSLASFHLNGGKKMSESTMDHLFKDGDTDQQENSKMRYDKDHQAGPQLVSHYQKQKSQQNDPALATPQVISHEQHPERYHHGDRMATQRQNRANMVSSPANTSGICPPKFLPVCSLEDVQAIRCAEFHPNGHIFAIGSNSKTLRVCDYPPMGDLSVDHKPTEMNVLFKKAKHHKGSIYCMAWSPTGDLIATGSNDKTVKILRFNNNTCNLDGNEIELTMHDGTVRDCVFMLDHQTLVSGGAGDCKIYLTDCPTGQVIHGMVGHSGHVLSLCTWHGSIFASGSQDKTVRFWDVRTRSCINLVQYGAGPQAPGSPIASCTVDPSGRLLVTGHEDATCCLYDIRGGRTVQTFKPHSLDVRSTRFSPNAYYLLSGGYDNRLVLTDLQGDLTQALPSVVVAQHQDKIISGRWHPFDFSFLSTSADKQCVLWGLPPL